MKPLYNSFDRAGIHDQSERRPAVAELRLADMDRDGVQAQVIFGPIFQISTDDAALRVACYRVYNDWLLEFCQAAPDRLIGAPMLPENPDAAYDELMRLCDPLHPDFALRRLDFHLLQSFTLVVGCKQD